MFATINFMLQPKINEAHLNAVIKLNLAVIFGFVALNAGAQSVSAGKINRVTDDSSNTVVTTSASAVTRKKIKQKQRVIKKVIQSPIASIGLRSPLQVWAESEGWTLMWPVNIPDVNLSSPIRLEGGAFSAIESLTSAIPPDSKIQITLYEGNKVIFVKPSYQTNSYQTAQPQSGSIIPVSAIRQPLIVITSGAYLPPSNSNSPAFAMASKQVIPVIEKWEIKAGESIRGNLDAWRKRAGWDMVWSYEGDFIAQAGATFDGNFQTAVKGLIAAMPESINIKIELSSNKLVYVTKGNN